MEDLFANINKAIEKLKLLLAFSKVVWFV